jgi:hypothetical protein
MVCALFISGDVFTNIVRSPVHASLVGMTILATTDTFLCGSSALAYAFKPPRHLGGGMNSNNISVVAVGCS